MLKVQLVSHVSLEGKQLHDLVPPIFGSPHQPGYEPVL